MMVIKSLEGVWEFVSAKMTDISGNPIPDPLGEAYGLIMYKGDYMSVQLKVPKVKNLANDNLEFQADCAFYCGKYIFDIDNQMVTHHVKFSNIAEMTGKSFMRQVEKLNDGEISLKNIKPEQLAIGIPIYRKIIWKRVG